MKIFSILLIPVMVLSLYAKERVHCEGRLQIHSIESVTQTRSGQTYVVSSVGLDRESFGLCTGQLGKFVGQVSREQPLQLQLQIAPDRYRIGEWYEASIYAHSYHERDKSAYWEITRREQEQADYPIRGFKTYRGSYLEVQYPLGFTSLRSVTHTQDTMPKSDEVWFRAPDGSVEFYLFFDPTLEERSAYLDTHPDEISLEQRSQKDSREGRYHNYLLGSQETLKEKNGLYYRSYVAQRSCHDDAKSRSFIDCNLKVIGIKYRDASSYERYKQAYLLFKKSLRIWQVE